MKTRLALILTLAAALAAPAFAQSLTHLDFTQVLVGIDGKPILQPSSDPSAKAQPMTLGFACVSALEAQLPEDRNAAGVDKFKLDALARKIYGQKDVVLSVDDVATIKARVGEAWGNTVVGAAWRLLDPSTVPPPAK